MWGLRLHPGRLWAAVGYDFNGVDFSGHNDDGVCSSWLGSPVTATRTYRTPDGRPYVDGLFWCCYGAILGLVLHRRQRRASALQPFRPTGIIDSRPKNPGRGKWHLSRLQDRFVARPESMDRARTISIPVGVRQNLAGLLTRSTKSFWLTPDGTVVDTVSDLHLHGHFTLHGVQLADGAIVMEEVG